jgi:hypothetical protein
MKPRPAYQEIATLIVAIKNCQKVGNEELEHRHSERLHYIQRNCLPSGSGFDTGCTIDIHRSNNKKIIIGSAYHPLNWIHFEVIVTPSFQGCDVQVKEPFSRHNAMDLKNYITETFEESLMEIVI